MACAWSNHGHIREPLPVNQNYRYNEEWTTVLFCCRDCSPNCASGRPSHVTAQACVRSRHVWLHTVHVRPVARMVAPEPRLHVTPRRHIHSEISTKIPVKCHSDCAGLDQYRKLRFDVNGKLQN